MRWERNARPNPNISTAIPARTKIVRGTSDLRRMRALKTSAHPARSKVKAANLMPKSPTAELMVHHGPSFRSQDIIFDVELT